MNSLDLVMSKLISAFQNKQYSQVKRACEKNLRKNPRDALSNSLLGAVLIEEKAYLRAVLYFEKAYKEDPNPEALYNLGRAQYFAGNFGSAEKSLKTYLSKRPRDAGAISVLGLTQRAVGKRHDAVVCFRRALELSPDSVDFMTNLALA